MDLNPEQKLLVRNAKKGLIRQDILDEFNLILSGKKSNPAHDLRPIHLIDDKYDGPENRSSIIRINPKNEANIFAAFLMKKFPGILGHYLIACFMFSGMKPKTRDRWIKRSTEMYYRINESESK